MGSQKEDYDVNSAGRCNHATVLMGKSNTLVQLQYKMVDLGKNTQERAHEHDKTKYRWPVLAEDGKSNTRGFQNQS